MHVASLERCRELYKLSEWADTPYVYHKNTFDKRGERSLAPMNYQLKYRDWAYDLSYLMRKLQLIPTTEPDIQDEPAIILEHSGIVKPEYRWSAKVFNGEWYEQSSTTPEDAAAKLAIELFKQGVLKREES